MSKQTVGAIGITADLLLVLLWISSSQAGTQLLPQMIGVPVSGGAASTWDGRVFVSDSGTGKLYAMIFRPEAIDPTPSLNAPIILG